MIRGTVTNLEALNPGEKFLLSGTTAELVNRQHKAGRLPADGNRKIILTVLVNGKLKTLERRSYEPARRVP